MLEDHWKNSLLFNRNFTDFTPTLHYAKFYHNSTRIITCECGFREQIVIIINIFDKGRFLSEIIETRHDDIFLLLGGKPEGPIGKFACPPFLSNGRWDFVSGYGHRRNTAAQAPLLTRTPSLKLCRPWRFSGHAKDKLSGSQEVEPRGAVSWLPGLGHTYNAELYFIGHTSRKGHTQTTRLSTSPHKWLSFKSLPFSRLPSLQRNSRRSGPLTSAQ